MMKTKNLLVPVSLLVALLGSVPAFAASSAQSSAEAPSSAERRYLFDPIELSPVMGFTVIDGSAGFNVGAHGAYPILSSAPLYLEPSLILGFFSGTTQFNITGAARYDIAVADTKLKPFARVGLGPTFQTSGSSVVFNATFGGGVMYPISRSLSLRAEAALVDIDGNAGFQLTGGISL